MMKTEIENFIKEKLKILPQKRGHIVDEIEFNVESIFNYISKIDVYRLTQEEIDEQYEDYENYYENLVVNEVVFYDGEVSFKIELLEQWIYEIESAWRNREYRTNDVQQYITYLYAQELASLIK